MHAVLAALFPVFLLIVAGFLLRRFLIAEDAHWVGMERLLYYVMFPALLIGTLARADLTKVPVLAVGGTLLAAVLVMSALCFALRPLLARRLGVDGPAFTSLFQGATRWQTFVALPLAGNLFGDLGLALASVAMVAMTPVLNVLCVSVLVRYASPAAPDWRAMLLAVVSRTRSSGPAWSGSRSIRSRRRSREPRARVRRRARALLARARPADRRRRPALGELIRPSAVALVTCVLKLVVMPAIAIAARASRSAFRAPTCWSRSAARRCRRRRIPTSWRARWAATRR